jgi:hypothetical protein
MVGEASSFFGGSFVAHHASRGIGTVRLLAKYSSDLKRVIRSAAAKFH